MERNCPRLNFNLLLDQYFLKGGENMETADAVVIGGGVMGTSIAYRLAKQGRKTVLVEKDSIASGASGSCDKAVFLQSKKPGFHMELAQESLNIYKQLEEELGISIEFQKAGGMIVIENEEQRRIMADLVAKQKAAGINVEMLDKDQTREIQPTLSTSIAGSAWSPDDAEVNPLLLAHAFKTASVHLGAKIWTNTEVTAINEKNGKVTEVITGKGSISTETVINAAGAHAAHVGKMVNSNIPISPRRGIILISEKVDPIVQGNVLCAQYMTAKHQRDQNSQNPYSVGLSFGQTDPGNLLIGGTREFVGFNQEFNPDILTAIANHAGRIVPFIRRLRIIRTMVGFRPSTGDGLPIVDNIPGVKGFYIAAGHEGDGIALSPITGHLVANLIDNDGPYLHLTKQLGLERFNSVN